MPQVIEQLPEAMRKLVGNPLIVTGTLVVGLNLLFRIGIAQNASLTLVADDPHPGRTINDFVESHHQGALLSLSDKHNAGVDLEALMNDDDADLSEIDSMMERISNQLIQRLADRVSTLSDKNGQSMLRLQFDH